MSWDCRGLVSGIQLRLQQPTTSAIMPSPQWVEQRAVERLPCSRVQAEVGFGAFQEHQSYAKVLASKITTTMHVRGWGPELSIRT